MAVAVISERELTTAQVMSEICYYITCQCAVYTDGHFIFPDGKASKHDGWRSGAPFSPRVNPGRLRLLERDFAAPPAPRTFFSIISRCMFLADMTPEHRSYLSGSM